MRIKVRNIMLACGLGLCLTGAGVGIGYSIKNAQAVNQIQAQINEETEETTIEKLKEKLSEIMNSQYASLIVSGGTTAAGVISFIITFFKYKKYQSLSSTEIAEVVSKISSEEMTKKYEELEEKVVNELIEKFGDIEGMMGEVITVLTMMQDTSTKGKQALIEYLASKVKESDVVDEEAKEAVEEAQESVAEEVEKEEEVKEEVAEDYQAIE